MKWEVLPVKQELCLDFLKINHANKEMVFIRPSDEWFAVFDNDRLVGCTGLYKWGRHFSVDCTFVLKEYRNQGICLALYSHCVNKYPNDKFICSCRPAAAHVLKKYLGFKCVKVWETGTEKCVKEV